MIYGLAGEGCEALLGNRSFDEASGLPGYFGTAA